jgi:hypothetical protein
VSHHQESVKSYRDGDDQFVVCNSLHCGEPASFPRVQKQEYDIVIFDELFQLHRRLKKLLVLCRVRANRVTRHRDAHHDSVRIHVRVNFPKSLSGYRSFKVILLLAVLKSEKALSHRVAERNAPTVHKGDLLGVSPGQ